MDNVPPQLTDLIALFPFAFPASLLQAGLRALGKQKSPLPDSFVDKNQIKLLIKDLNDNKSILRLNHIGFCYKVSSQSEERNRITKGVLNTDTHLYEMKSNDEGLWLFLGNAANWEDPMTELLPVEKTGDRWVNYWLPHIHIDIDTALPYQKIEDLIKKCFKGQITPFRSCVIDNVIYSIRARLGTVSGINFMLDLSTNKRKTQFSREHLLQLLA